MNDKCFEMTQSTPAGRHGGRLLENLFQSKHLKWKKIGSLESKTSSTDIILR